MSVIARIEDWTFRLSDYLMAGLLIAGVLAYLYCQAWLLWLSVRSMIWRLAGI